VTSFWRQALETTRVDLVVERRSGDTLTITLPFAVVALMVFPLAQGTNLGLVSTLASGLFWAVGILFGMQIALRGTASDNVTRRDLQMLVGLDPAARFTGRVMSGTILTTMFLVSLEAAALVLLSPELAPGSWWVLALVTPLVAIGLAELGTLAGDVTSGLRNRSALAALIVAPLTLPIVIGAAQSIEAVAQDTGILVWILLLLASDLALAVVGVALAGPLEEATR